MYCLSNNAKRDKGGAGALTMISGLDHVNIETLDLESSVQFYTRVLGLEDGWRPSFDVPGAWLYVGDQPIVHLVVRDSINDGPTGAIHHVALKASDLEATLQRLADAGVDYKKTVVPDLSVTQLFVTDPNGVMLELNFYADTVE